MRLVLPLSALVVCTALSFDASAKATITITTTDAAGTGFNDPTAATPIDGNTGTTVGELRMRAPTA